MYLPREKGSESQFIYFHENFLKCKGKLLLHRGTYVCTLFITATISRLQCGAPGGGGIMIEHSLVSSKNNNKLLEFYLSLDLWFKQGQ